MLKKYIGKNRAENLDWLVKKWLKEGPPVCFLEGFPGVGKSDLARDFREIAEQQGHWQHALIDEIADRPTPSVVGDLTELSEKLSNQGLPEMEDILLGEANPNIAFALEKVLGRPVVIIIDESQRFFRADSGRPQPDWDGVLAHLRNRPTLAGRLLLLSDRMVERARWSESFPIRTLAKLEPDEALEVFDDRLQIAHVTEEIAPERKQDLVRALDYNPRAIEALVSALAYDTLDEIIGRHRSLWDVRDREVSREFLSRLERDLLEHTMAHLDVVHYQRLLWLSVHRKSFKKRAVEMICGTKEEVAALRDVLVTRFLVNHYKGDLALNPIVREISLARLREEPSDFKQAHSKAADYHLRHFTAKQIAGSQAKLGLSFAELRYHLVHAQRENELRQVVHRFTDHLKLEIKSVSPVPTDREELEERVGVLSVLLETEGAKGLEYHLARCLKQRGKPGDLKRAAMHAARATGTDSRAESWVLRARLESQVDGIDAALRTIREAVRKVSANDSIVSLYQVGGDLLQGAGRTDEAVTLLKDGIKVIPADKNLFSLYQLCAELLAGAGRTEEAVTLLKDGIKAIPPQQNVFSLYQSCAEILARDGKTNEAVTLLKDGIRAIPPDKGVSSLYQVLGEVYCRAGNTAEAIVSQREGVRVVPNAFNRYRLVEGALLLCLAAGDARQLNETLAATGADVLDRQQLALGEVLKCQDRGDWAAAAELARSARIEFPRYFVLAAQEALSRLANGDAEGAHRVLTGFPNLVSEKGDPHEWLAAFIHLRRGAPDEAEKALAAYLGRPIEPLLELTESFLLRLWDQQEDGAETQRLCFHYPILPPSLTGQDHVVRRIQFSAPVLPVAAARGAPLASSLRGDQPLEPDAYVSYAWGEDTTPEGRQREEIVDRLCEAVHVSGRTIGRDKQRMSAGDSIERFALEISKARRIIAVLSEKSLNSPYCMAHELFRAYRRCDYQRAEFQEKVIALVMDDAKALLKDDLAVVALARTWKGKYEKLRVELEAVDPRRKSAAKWVFVDLMEEMCPRLPDMLDAIRDIVMKRGFDEIVADGFREVLQRLPPPN